MDRPNVTQVVEVLAKELQKANVSRCVSLTRLFSETAHVNVGVGKLKGPHFTFEGSQKTVDRLISRLFDC